MTQPLSMQGRVRPHYRRQEASGAAHTRCCDLNVGRSAWQLRSHITKCCARHTPRLARSDHTQVSVDGLRGDAAVMVGVASDEDSPCRPSTATTCSSRSSSPGRPACAHTWAATATRVSAQQHITQPLGPCPSQSLLQASSRCVEPPKLPRHPAARNLIECAAHCP
jgi:hypothetical protein